MGKMMDTHLKPKPVAGQVEKIQKRNLTRHQQLLAAEKEWRIAPSGTRKKLAWQKLNQIIAQGEK